MLEIGILFTFWLSRYCLWCSNCIFAYIGFDAVATSAEEAKNPSRDVPIGILGSLAVCTLLYFIVAMVLTGIVPYTQLNNAEPVAYALRVIGYPFGSAIVAVGAICGITTVLLVLLYGQARVFFALSRDGMIPRVFVECIRNIIHHI